MKVSLIVAASILATVSAFQDKCQKSGSVAVVVDGLSKTEGPKVLAALKEEEIKALVVFGREILTGSDVNKLVASAKKDKHEIGFRYVNKITGAKLSAETVKEDLQKAKNKFKNTHNLTLKYVVFNHTDDEDLRTKLAKIAKSVGLTAVGHNLYLEGNNKSNQTKIENNFTDADSESYIALLQGHIRNQTKTIEALAAQVKENSFTFTSMSKCVSSAAANASESVEEDKKKKPSGRKGKKDTKKTTRKSSYIVNPNHIKGYKDKKKSSGKTIKKGGKLADSTVDESDKKQKRGKKLKALKALADDPDKVVEVKKGEKKENTEAQGADKENSSAMVKVGTGFLFAAVATVVAVL